MSNTFFDDLDALVQKHRTQESQEAQRNEFNERMDKLDSSLGTLAESVQKLVQHSTPAADSTEGGNGGGAAPTSSHGDNGAPPPNNDNDSNSDPELPLERVSRLQVPKIYNGDDEPETIRYVDPDTGEEKTRKGRRKGHPSGYEVEAVEATTTGTEE